MLWKLENLKLSWDFVTFGRFIKEEGLGSLHLKFGDMCFSVEKGEFE